MVSSDPEILVPKVARWRNPVIGAVLCLHLEIWAHDQWLMAIQVTVMNTTSSAERPKNVRGDTRAARPTMPTDLVIIVYFFKYIYRILWYIIDK